MEKISHCEALMRYLYNIPINNHNFVFQKYKEIQDYEKNNNLNTDTVRTLLYQITNYNDELVINLLHFVNRLKLSEATKEDIRAQIFSIHVNEDSIYNLYNMYVDYLDVIPIG